MKRLLTTLLIILTIVSCKKEEFSSPANRTGDRLAIEPSEPTTPKRVGFFIDTNWFKRKFPGYWIETHNGFGGGDFNKDGLKDLVVMFATNTPEKYFFQKDTSSRIVVGVFISYKTYFQLDTNLVYSYLGGFTDVTVSDINNDGFLDIYQMTGYWKGINNPKPSYYTNSGRGGMDSYAFINNKNKSLTKHTIPIKSYESGSTISIISDNNKNGYKEIYNNSCQCYFEFNGNTFNRTELSINKSFQNKSYSMGVLTPKYQSEKTGVIFTAEAGDGEYGFILKLDGDRIVPIIKFKKVYPNSGPAQEILVNDLDRDGKIEYIIPMEISSNSNNTIPAVPHLMIVDENGNDVSLKYMDEEITKPLTHEQINWIGETWVTGFIYHTFADIDNDGIEEIFPASGIGYKKGNDTYYYKFINGKYRLKFYHSGWFGDIHKPKEYISYKAFVDEKFGVNVFLTIEGDLRKSVVKSF